MIIIGKINSWKDWITVIVLAIVGGAVGYLTHFPLGTFLGAVIIISVWKLLRPKVPSFPPKIKKIVQVIVGGNIGLAFTNETFSLIKAIWLPGVLISLINIVFAVLLVIIFHRFLKYDILTALASSAPAGMSEMALIAEKYETDIPTVLSIHLFRVIVIITTIPFLVSLVMSGT